MNTTTSDPLIPAIIAKLTAPSEAPLTTDERAVLTSALAQLATAQLTIAKQTLLLRSFNQDVSTTEHHASTLLAATTAGLPITTFSFEGAAVARRELLDTLESGGKLTAILSAVLNFAMRSL